MGLGENTHGLALTLEVARIALRNMLVPNSHSLLGFTHHFRDENGNFFPGEAVLQQNRIWECTSNGPSCTNGASGCAMRPEFANTKHPRYLDITWGQNPTMPPIVDGASRGSRFRIEYLKINRITLLARFLHPRYYSALTSVLLNNCMVEMSGRCLIHQIKYIAVIGNSRISVIDATWWLRAAAVRRQTNSNFPEGANS